MNPVHQDPFLGETSLESAENRGAVVSCFVDGELSLSEVDALLQDSAEDADVLASWQTYHLIGDVLRGSSDRLLPAQSAQVFVAEINRRLRSESVLQHPSGSLKVQHVRPAAANDSVFRWKLVAGAASLAAVVAVSWTLIGGAGTPATTGPQMALMSEPAASSATGSVVVQTTQGQVVRDVRLEELLAEHRQYGGMSALQMPAGFLRNATYDAAPQR